MHAIARLLAFIIILILSIRIIVTEIIIRKVLNIEIIIIIIIMIKRRLSALTEFT